MVNFVSHDGTRLCADPLIFDHHNFMWERAARNSREHILVRECSVFPAAPSTKLLAWWILCCAQIFVCTNFTLIQNQLLFHRTLELPMLGTFSVLLNNLPNTHPVNLPCVGQQTSCLVSIISRSKPSRLRDPEITILVFWGKHEKEI